MSDKKDLGVGRRKSDMSDKKDLGVEEEFTTRTSEPGSSTSSIVLLSSLWTRATPPRLEFTTAHL